MMITYPTTHTTASNNHNIKTKEIYIGWWLGTPPTVIQCFITKDGYTEWWKNRLASNMYGPAVTWLTGYKEWRVNGTLHRLYGPAVEYSDGGKEYWINGIEYSYLEYLVSDEQYKNNTHDN